MRYTRALKQRNAALRSNPRQAGAWDSELARLGEQIAEARRAFIEQLPPYWREAVAALSGLEVQLHYSRGWNAEPRCWSPWPPRVPVMRHAPHPRGPHRADVAVRMDGRPAREVLSRGQQKLVAVAMTVAQLRLLKELTGTTPTLLLDDPAAELDGERLRRFIDQVLLAALAAGGDFVDSESRLFGSYLTRLSRGTGRVQHV